MNTTIAIDVMNLKGKPHLLTRTAKHQPAHGTNKVLAIDAAITVAIEY